MEEELKSLIEGCNEQILILQSIKQAAILCEKDGDEYVEDADTVLDDLIEKMIQLNVHIEETSKFFTQGATGGIT